MPRNLRSDIAMFLAYLAGRSPRVLRWDPAGRRSDGTPATVLILRDRIPRPPFRRGAPTFEITSEAQRLTGRRFGSEAARVINTAGAKGHGRTLTCLDVATKEPVAAISFHRQDAAPLLVTAIAVLESEKADAAGGVSRAMAGVLLCYLAAAAVSDGLPPRLGFAPSDRVLADRLGFRAAGPPPAYAGAGGRYLEWQPGPSLARVFPPRGLLGFG